MAAGPSNCVGHAGRVLETHATGDNLTLRHAVDIRGLAAAQGA